MKILNKGKQEETEEAYPKQREGESTRKQKHTKERPNKSKTNTSSTQCSVVQYYQSKRGIDTGKYAIVDSTQGGEGTGSDLSRFSAAPALW